MRLTLWHRSLFAAILAMQRPHLGGCVRQVIQLPIPFTGGRLFYGTGVISVIGISFTFLPVAQTSIKAMMVSRHATDATDACDDNAPDLVANHNVTDDEQSDNISFSFSDLFDLASQISSNHFRA